MSSEHTPLSVHRPSARTLVIDGDGRLLLFRNVEEGHGLPDFWIAPGGGVKPSESFEDAALRELLEETGFVAGELGPCVWRRQATFQFRETTYDTDDRFFIVRVPVAFEPSFATLEDVERAAIREHPLVVRR